MGFQGFGVEGVEIKQPTKKPRGGALTAEQKEDNQRIASEKMRVEHTMCSVKRCRVVKDKVRYWQTTFRDLVMAIACGLHNLRLRHRPWNYNPYGCHRAEGVTTMQLPDEPIEMVVA